MDFAGLKIKLASPEVMREWSFGEVIRPETINYRTLKAEKDGLFSESIFGPTKDWECYCGKYKRIRYKGIICDKCGVEVTHSRVRRERMGHITLVAPVAHIWFFKGISSKLSMLLDIPPKSLESVIYFSQYLLTDVDQDAKKEVLKNLDEELISKKKEIKDHAEQEIKKLETGTEAEIRQEAAKINNKERRALYIEEQKLKLKQKIQTIRDEVITEGQKVEEIHRRVSEMVRKLKKRGLLTEEEYLSLSQHKAASFFKAGMGAEVVLQELKEIDLEKLSQKLKKEVKETKGARYLKATKRLRLVEAMRLAQVDPSWTILRILPVIPPDLRPMVQLVGGRFATSDLNDLYRRVINRNNRLKHLLDLGAPEIILRNEKRMLQEAVDSLIDGSKRPTRRFRRRVQPLRSLSDMLRGKQGRFRQNLLGKRVDYSGRSVIVVGPDLKLRQCGLPKEMALEMFKPFVLREMIFRGLAPNVKSAKNIFEHRPPEIFDILDEITREHPVLLNRAPTLHKLGIQAFYPVLIEGNAIRLHPCLCSGYNADFDGDQMAVHVPLSTPAREEAAKYMLAEKNLLKPADGSPITVPGKEMALGCYFVTSEDEALPLSPLTFSSPTEAIFAFQQGTLKLRQKIKVRLEQGLTETTVGRLLFSEITPKELGFINEGVREPMVKVLVTKALQVCSRETVVEFIDKLKEIGFWGATLSGLSVGVWDCEVYPEKSKVISRANDQVAEVERNLAQGLITVAEKRRLTQQIWIDTTEELMRLTWEQFHPGNSIRLMVEAGLRRANKDLVKQLSAMQGLLTDPMGRIVELPNKSSFREGLSVFEYVTSARGARKGLTDTALKTSDAGYLTRRLVDVAHEVIVRQEDCGTHEGIKIIREGLRKEKFLNRVLGRIIAKDITNPKNKKIILKAGEWLDEGNINLLDQHEINEVWVRSPLTCEARFGICANCYGWDFSTKKVVEIGTPVGVLAAQSIGEPGTQLTLQTKHFGGIIRSDVTRGLPRVEELFEIRMPKILSPLSEIAGKVTVKETEEGGYQVVIRSVGVKPVEEREYFIPPLVKLTVENGQLVDAGTQLATGALDIREILAVRGLKAAQEYLIDEIQGVYESQGIGINDRHFEVITRKMSDKVQIETAGDTNFLPGELVSKARFGQENERVLAEGGEPATAQVTVLGITRASLYTESWLSAASFQETTNILTEAALEAREDWLIGLKENVIIGRLIPVLPDRARLEE